MTRSLPAAAALALALAGCGDPPTTTVDAALDPSASAPATTTATPVGLPSARRPTKRYYLGKTPIRCEIYTIDGAVTSPPLVTRCPVEIVTGERIRIAGKTCTRESPDPDRQQPVVCPDSLTNKEKEDRARDLPR